MGFFARLKTGWALAMDSLDVLRDHPRLALFPLLAGIAGAVYVGLLTGSAYLITGPDAGPASLAVLFLVYLGSTFIASYFTAALTYNTREALEGREPSMRAGLAAAWHEKGTLLTWAVVSAIVGVALRVIEKQDSPVARIVAGIFSVSWGILTYFVIPVIVFEEVGAREMFERSGRTFRDTWGETTGAGFGVGIVTILFVLAGIALAAVVFVVLGGAVGLLGAIAVGAIAILVAFLLGNTLGTIARTALYLYATEGEQPAAFDDVDFSRAVR